MKLKKIAYRTVYGLLGTETLTFILQFYKMYQENQMITLPGGYIIAPYWLLFEGCFIGLAPILTKRLIKAFQNQEICDDTELANLIEILNNKVKQ